jgi:diphthamide synthase (EF-2-diphthine--ammonia ligase)
MNTTGDNMTGEVIVSEPRHSVEDSCHVASVSIIVNGKPWELRYKIATGPIAYGADAFYAATLILAMKIGRSLRMKGGVSPRLLRATPTIQDIFNKWYPEFQKIVVEAEPKSPEVGKHQKGVGCFFSGGVDSFYTLLKHREEITKIIFVHGFDISLANQVLRAEVAKEIRWVAVQLKKELIEVETNLREFSDSYAIWGRQFFGSALASVAHLLSGQLNKIYIPSSESFAHLDPCGSHPLLDPLWSTEHLEIVHDGCEASRNEKVAVIAQNDVVLQSLRVCTINSQNSYNCGICEKCLRTMITLHAVGALEQCKTFNRKLEPEAVANIQIHMDLVLYHVEENLQAIERLGNEPALAQALRNCINNYKQKTLEKEINKNLDSSENSPWWRDLVSRRKNSFFKAIWEKEKAWLAREVIKESIKSWDVKLFKGKLYGLFRARWPHIVLAVSLISQLTYGDVWPFPG